MEPAFKKKRHVHASFNSSSIQLLELMTYKFTAPCQISLENIETIKRLTMALTANGKLQIACKMTLAFDSNAKLIILTKNRTRRAAGLG